MLDSICNPGQVHSMVELGLCILSSFHEFPLSFEFPGSREELLGPLHCFCLHRSRGQLQALDAPTAFWLKTAIRPLLPTCLTAQRLQCSSFPFSTSYLLRCWKILPKKVAIFLCIRFSGYSFYCWQPSGSCHDSAQADEVTAEPGETSQ